MSLADQQRWDERYRAGAYSERTHPSVFLTERLPALGLTAGARALDLACGAGRNALYLAAEGFAVTGIDGSAVALERAAARSAADADIHWEVADLEQGLPSGLGYFDLIVLVRYVNAPLLASLPAALRPGGVLLVEQHLMSTQPVGGPGRDTFRVSRNELRSAVPQLTCVVAEQGLIPDPGLGPDPDGKPMALSRLLARRPDEGELEP